MFLVDVFSVLIGSSKLTPVELSTRRLCSGVDMWRHRGGMSCACPGRLEVSRGIVEAKHVTSDRHSSSAVDLTNTNSCQLKSTHMTPTNCSRITSGGLVRFRRSEPKEHPAKQVPNNVGNVPVKEFTLKDKRT